VGSLSFSGAQFIQIFLLSFFIFFLGSMETSHNKVPRRQKSREKKRKRKRTTTTTTTKQNKTKELVPPQPPK